MMGPPPMRPSAASPSRGQHQRTGKAGSAVFAWVISGLTAVVSTTGCSSSPPQPDWKLNAQGALERGAIAYLEGRSAVAEREFGLARREIASTGRPDLLARAELLRCAAQVASLAFEPCTAFDALRADAPAAELAYAAYLSGKVTAAELALLPPHHRAIAAATDATAPAALQAMPDALSRQIGAAVLLQSGRAGPPVIAQAIDNASAQGWRRPLLAWLKLQTQRAQAAGDTAAVDALQRRISLVESGS